MALQVFNTLTKRKEEFVPLEPGHVRMYVCGVTVYDLCHIGHARSAIVFDVIVRYLRHRGFLVTYARNFTDVDDKIIRRANEEGVASFVIAERFIGAFYEDMDRLGILRPDFEPRATEHIEGMLEIVKTLVAKGIAYESGGDVYFAVEKFPGYGKLSGQPLDEMMAGARVEVSEQKHNPLDFALWKASKPGEPAWESPWGPGRPGWHIECSAMGKALLGATFDIHGGGKDLIFPHHENEIAQSEAAFGVPFARYWLHNGFVNINNEKMSKSLGNFFTIRDILKTVHPEALRLFVLGKHYRSPVDFSDDAVTDAERGLDRLYGTLAAVSERTEGAEAPEKAQGAADAELFSKVAAVPGEFTEAMENDFNTALALGHLFELQRILQRFLDGAGRKRMKGAGAALARRAAAVMREHAGVLGLLTREPAAFTEEMKALKIHLTGLTAEEVERRIEERKTARAAKDFALSDRIRAELLEAGIQIDDTPEGTRWRVMK